MAKSRTESYSVSPDLTAEAMGSGDMPVLATPALVAMMENCAMKLAADELADGDTTVGSFISTSHLKPSKVGAQISVTATLDAVEGRKLSFSITALDGDTLIAEASHVRFVVTRQRFLDKLG